MPKPILIAGPTASGKSSLAMSLVERFGGAIVNADSQQVYRDWRLLTARPSEADEAKAPHYLFGHLAMSETCSVGRWLREVRLVLAECRETGQRPVIVGGTGLYFKALTNGIAPIPETPRPIRTRGEAQLAERGLPAFATELAERDPKTAENIDLENPMRVLRAWEVLETTGLGLADWQSQNDPPTLPLEETLPILIQPERERLYERCDERFEQMVLEGALGEVRRVAEMNLPPDIPGMRALGARELLGHVEGRLSLLEAIDQAQKATRQYAKRQLTWGRNQMRDWIRIERADADLTPVLEKAGL